MGTLLLVVADAKCHDQCAGSCVGPGDRDCLPCREDENCANAKCVNFEFEGRCVPECSSNDGLFANATTGTCQRCHEQCDGACNGPVSKEKSSYTRIDYSFNFQK